MKCFYHPDRDGVGICQQCGKSACRDCIEDFGGSMFCNGCVAREQAAQAQLAQEEEQHQVLQQEDIKRQASRRIRWSYIIAGLAAVFYSGFALVGAIEGGVPPLLLFALVFGGPYVIWSIFWGLIWFWPHWKGFVRSFKRSLSGWILIARPFIWLMILMFYAVFYISIPLSVAIYYGIFGGSIYQFRKHLRLASGGGEQGADPARRSRNVKVGAGIAIVILLAFSLSVWQGYRQITHRLASSGSTETPPSYVSDEAHVLDGGTTTSLNDLCAEANEKYKARIALFTVANLNGASVQSLAQNLLQRQSGTGNRTIVIVLAPHNRSWRIQYGNGFAATITNENTKAIGHEALPSLRAENYGAALLTMVRGVIASLEKEPGGNANIAPVKQDSSSDTLKGQVMDCRPSTLEIGSTLTLHLPSNHGGELAVQTPSLVSLYIAYEQEQGVYNVPPPIPSAQFKTMQSVTLTGSSVGISLGSIKPQTPIFSSPGVYHFMVGRNLESDDEMHRNLLCDVRVIAAKAG